MSNAIQKVYTHTPEYSDYNDRITAVEHDNGQYVLITDATSVLYTITHVKETDQITITES